MYTELPDKYYYYPHLIVPPIFYQILGCLQCNQSKIWWTISGKIDDSDQLSVKYFQVFFIKKNTHTTQVVSGLNVLNIHVHGKYMCNV